MTVTSSHRHRRHSPYPHRGLLQRRWGLPQQCDQRRRQQQRHLITTDDGVNDIDADTTVEALTVTLTLSATCATDQVVTVNATQTQIPVFSDTVICEATPNISIIKQTSAATSQLFNFSISGNSSECDSASFNLGNAAQADFTCDVPGTYQITENGPPQAGL